MSNDPIRGYSIPEPAAETQPGNIEAPQPKPKRPWLKGCALGCGGLVALMLMTAALGFLLRGHIAGLLRASFAGQYTSNCTHAKQLGKLTEPDDDPFSDVMVSIQRPETSLMAAVYACVLLERRLASSEDASRAKSVAAATDLRELLYNDPAAKFQDIATLIQKYPELSAGNWYSKFVPPPPGAQH